MKPDEPLYPAEPEDPAAYTDSFDRSYSRFARLYDWAIRLWPGWGRWIRAVLPHVRGSQVLEISFGTGSLFPHYGGGLELYGVEYNWEMIQIARTKGGGPIRPPSICQADVVRLPYPEEAFDCLVNTMAFTGYPDAEGAILEMRRVLRPGGRLLMVDVNYPQDGNWPGVRLARAWIRLGDIVRDMDRVFRLGGFQYEDRKIGGWGSVHLYLATKPVVE